MMGSSHMTKILCTCIGYYITNSGVEHILIETELFGVGVVQQILSGSHYSRCTKGFFMLGEALHRLQIEAFFKENIKNYDYEVVTLKTDTFAENNYVESKALYDDVCQSSSNLVKDFQDFIIKRSEESPLFKYWSNVLKLIQLLRDIIRADRTGNWTYT